MQWAHSPRPPFGTPTPSGGRPSLPAPLSPAHPHCLSAVDALSPLLLFPPSVPAAHSRPLAPHGQAGWHLLVFFQNINPGAVFVIPKTPHQQSLCILISPAGDVKVRHEKTLGVLGAGPRLSEGSPGPALSPGGSFRVPSRDPVYDPPASPRAPIAFRNGNRTRARAQRGTALSGARPPLAPTQGGVLFHTGCI